MPAARTTPRDTSRSGWRASPAVNVACCQPPYDQRTPIIAAASAVDPGAAPTDHVASGARPATRPATTSVAIAPSLSTVIAPENDAATRTPTAFTTASAASAASATATRPAGPSGTKNATYS